MYGITIRRIVKTALLVKLVPAALVVECAARCNIDPRHTVENFICKRKLGLSDTGDNQCTTAAYAFGVNVGVVFRNA